MNSVKLARAQIKRVLLSLAGFSFMVNLLLLTIPLYMLQIYDRVLPSRSMDTLVFLTVFAIFALVVLGMLEAVRAVLASRAAARLETILGSDALRVSMKLARHGEADVQPVRNLVTIRTFVSSRAVFSLLDMPFAPLFVGILYIIHPILFWLTLIGAVALFVLAFLNQRMTTEASGESQESLGHAMMSAQAFARNAHTIKAMGMADNVIAAWGDKNATSLIAQSHVDSRTALLSGVSKTIRMGLQIAMLGVGALLVLNGSMTAGMIFAASILSSRGLQPIDQVIGGWKNFASTWAAWESLNAAMAQAGEEAPKTLMDPPRGEIVVDSALVMSIGGVSKPPVLNRVALSISPGDVIGVVGPSGSGKSTLARLLVGAQTPHSGTVRIDGTEVPNWEPAQLGSHIGYLGQEVELLPGTVAQNIARLAQTPNSAAVLEAARKAQVHELIQNLPQGYDTILGPGGHGLSGGQRQRVGLARAFYGNPKIMILDEPNANLDDDGEEALQKAILAARQSGVTLVVITQRKQVLNAVDKILRLHQGNVDFFGTRQEFVQTLQAHRLKMQGRLAANANPTKTHPPEPVTEKTEPAADHAAELQHPPQGPQQEPPKERQHPPAQEAQPVQRQVLVPPAMETPQPEAPQPEIPASTDTPTAQGDDAPTAPVVPDNHTATAEHHDEDQGAEQDGELAVAPPAPEVQAETDKPEPEAAQADEIFDPVELGGDDYAAAFSQMEMSGQFEAELASAVQGELDKEQDNHDWEDDGDDLEIPAFLAVKE